MNRRHFRSQACRDAGECRSFGDPIAGVQDAALVLREDAAVGKVGAVTEHGVALVEGVVEATQEPREQRIVVEVGALECDGYRRHSP